MTVSLSKRSAVGLLLIAGLVLAGLAPRTSKAWQDGTVVQGGTVISLDGPNWLLAQDPQNLGRDQQWFKAPVSQAQPARVPWVIQDTIPDYHGVAWFWRRFDAP